LTTFTITAHALKNRSSICNFLVIFSRAVKTAVDKLEPSTLGRWGTYNSSSLVT